MLDCGHEAVQPSGAELSGVTAINPLVAVWLYVVELLSGCGFAIIAIIILIIGPLALFGLCSQYTR